MANVSFLRGTQAKLDALLASQSPNYVEGAFYLTTDSDRLYFAQSSTELVHLNHNIIHVANIAALPNISDAVVGDFYYAIEENVLCTKKKDGASWTQINKNTNTNDDTYVSGISAPSVESDANGVTVKFDIQQKKVNLISNDEVAVDPIEVSFTIDSADLAAANNVAVGVGTTAIENGVTVATAGAGASEAGFNVVGGENVTISRDASGNITIAAADENTLYELSAAGNNIVLTNGDSDDEDKVAVRSANDAITFTADNNELVVTHKEYTTSETASAATDANPGHGDNNGFKVIDGITTDKGHITGYTVKTVKLPQDNDTTSKLLVKDGHQVVLHESNNDESSVSFIAQDSDIVLTTTATAEGGNSGSISIGHKQRGAATETTSTAGDLSHGGSFTVIDSVKTENGHLTEYNVKTVVLPADKDTTNKEVTASADAQGKITVTVKDSNDDVKTGISGQDLFYEIPSNMEGTTFTKVYNQGKLDVYTRAQVDKKLQGLNAMAYKGTLGEGGTVAELPSSGVAAGDTYKVSVAGVYNGQTCRVGDLLIATGVETDGVITSDLAWTYVPSGDDIDSQYEMSVADNTITLTNITSDDVAGTATIAQGNDIVVTTEGSTITIAHEKFEAPTKAADVTADHSADYGVKEITVLDSITTDNGHVTGYTNKVIKLPADQDTKSSISVESVNGNSVIRVTESNGKYADDTSDVAVKAANDFVTVVGDTANDSITIGHKTYDALAATSGDALTLGTNKVEVVTGVTRDNGGHLSGYTVQELILPADKDTKSKLGTDNAGGIVLTEDSGDKYTVALTAGTQIAISSAESATNGAITIAHTGVTTTKTTDTGVPTDERTIDVVDSLEFENGHVKKYNVKTITLPEDKDTTYTYAGAVSAASNVATYASTLTNNVTSDVQTSEMKLASSSLQVTANASTVSMDLVWGSF